MEPGIYTLTHDVENPNADKRVKYDWRRMPLWKTGMTFHVAQDDAYDCMVVWRTYRSYEMLLSKVPAVLLDALVLSDNAADRIDAALESAHLGNWQIEALVRLVERGDVSIEQVVSAAKEAAEE